MSATGQEVKPIPLQPVKSSNVTHVGYCKDSMCLDIKFKSGAVYRYDGVSQDNFDCMLRSKSIGKHVNKHIVKGGFGCCKQ